MDWTEKRQCVLCNKGGKLLVCNDDGCPISVHKSCMGCKARLDNAGNFHCPYCLYRRLTAETCRLREKAMLAKKALSKFLDEEMREPIDGMASKNKQVQNNFVYEDVGNQSIHLEKHQRSKIPLPCEEARETFISEQTNINTCRMMVVYEANANPVNAVNHVNACGVDRYLDTENGMKTDQIESDVSKRVVVENRKGSAKCEFGVPDDQQHVIGEAKAENAVVSSSIEKQSTCQKRNHSVAFNTNRNRRKDEGMVENAAKSNREIDNDDDSDSQIIAEKRKHMRQGPKNLLDHLNGPTKGSSKVITGVASCQEIVNISNPREVKDSSEQLAGLERSTKLPLQNGKRRVRWSEEEEDMLKEGVQKFSQVTRKNLPWKKILEFGRHVFDASRTPSDLKDKWRNLAK